MATGYPREDEERLKSNLEKVRLLMRDGEWHSLEELRGVGGSAADSRVRDLRKDQHGSLNVEAEKVSGGTWRYRVAPGVAAAPVKAPPKALIRKTSSAPLPIVYPPYRCSPEEAYKLIDTQEGFDRLVRD